MFQARRAENPTLSLDYTFHLHPAVLRLGSHQSMTMSRRRSCTSNAAKGRLNNATRSIRFDAQGKLFNWTMIQYGMKVKHISAVF